MTHRKRIAIIAHPLHAGGGISVGRNLIAALAKVAPEHDYLISIPSGLGYEEVVALVQSHELSVFRYRGNLLKRWRYERTELKPALRRFRPDLILPLASKGVGRFECPQAILCHNSYLWYPSKHYGSYPPKEMVIMYLTIWILRFCLRRDLKDPRNILLHQTLSARDRIANFFDLRATPIHCPNAVSNFTTRCDDTHSTPDRIHRYADRFKMFYLARYYPHKNIEAIVETFRRYRGDLQDAVVFITIGANQHAGARRLLQAIERYNLQDHVVNVGPLAQEELGGWFSHCDALLMPTLLESFSASYLEAMHFGLPILTSDLDFAREICEDAAFYFDPWDTASIRNAIIEVKNRPDMAKELVAKGKECLARMDNTWEGIAMGVLEAIQAVADEGKMSREAKTEFAQTMAMVESTPPR